jgi:hypothetical protein
MSRIGYYLQVFDEVQQTTGVDLPAAVRQLGPMLIEKLTKSPTFVMGKEKNLSQI